jgi:hypothetical protein
MAWTPPRTWVAGDSLLASQLNTHLRDNMVDLDGRVSAIVTNNASGLTTGTLDVLRLPVGSVLQHASTTKQNDANQSIARRTISSTDVPGLTVSITPKYSSSKVIVRGVIHVSASSDDVPSAFAVLYKKTGTGSSDALASATGSASGSKTQATGYTHLAGRNRMGSISFEFLDTAGSTSELTYSIRLAHGGTNSDPRIIYVNRAGNESDSKDFARVISTISATEIRA